MKRLSEEERQKDLWRVRKLYGTYVVRTPDEDWSFQGFEEAASAFINCRGMASLVDPLGQLLASKD